MPFEPVMQNKTSENGYLAESPFTVKELKNRDTEFFNLIVTHLYQPENPAEIEEGLLDFEVDEILNALENWKL